MAVAYKFHHTAHIDRRARERGFSVEQAKLTINEPALIVKEPVRKGNHSGLIWLFSREFGSKILVAVAEVKGNECWIITGYWEERA